jgi:outer membrane protein assembly factor BamB
MNRHRFITGNLAGLAFAVVAADAFAAGAGDWPQKMGPDRNGVLPGQNLAADFPDGKPPVLWQAHVGFGTAPVVTEPGRVYTFGLFRPGTSSADLASTASIPTHDEIRDATFWDKPNPAKFLSKDLPGTPAWEESHPCFRGDEYALCLDAATGNPIWTTRLTDYGLAYANHAAWDMASPLLTGGKLVLHSPTGRLYCLNASDGARIWERNLFECQMFRWTEKQGNACGPLAVGDTVIVGFMGRMDPDYDKPAGTTCPVVAGLDAATGRTRWVTRAPFESFRSMNCRIGFAMIHGDPTVLVPCGTATVGIDPATGKVRWSYVIPRDKDVWAPYPSYAPVAWQDHVIDNVSVAHDDKPSRTWCIRIVDNEPKLLWETRDFVPHTEIFKSNVVVKDGKLYGFDAHGIWDTPGKPSEQREKMQPGRNYRGRDAGQFQCRDIATGNRLWGTNAFEPPEVDPLKWPGEWLSTNFLLAGDRLVVRNEWGLWIARLKDDGVTVQTRVKDVGSQGNEPVLVEGRVFVRRVDCRSGRGNLTCLDLRAK